MIVINESAIEVMRDLERSMKWGRRRIYFALAWLAWSVFFIGVDANGSNWVGVAVSVFSLGVWSWVLQWHIRNFYAAKITYNTLLAVDAATKSMILSMEPDIETLAEWAELAPVVPMSKRARSRKIKELKELRKELTD